MAAPFEVVAHIVEWVAIAFSVAWGPVVLALPWIAVGALWHVGRGHANAGSGWLAAKKDDDADTGLVVTADTIVLALQNLQIPALRKAFKDGWKPTFHTLPVRDGRGYSAVFSLPLGVTAEMIADQRPVLARNVHRAEIEVWPSRCRAGRGRPGRDRGNVDRGHRASCPSLPPSTRCCTRAPPTCSRACPAGVSPRGDEIADSRGRQQLRGGGQMGQGKSNACRVVMLGCALDPLAELDVFVFANNGDFDAYAPRLARYVKGVEDDAIMAAVNRLHELYAEVGPPRAAASRPRGQEGYAAASAGPPGHAADRGAVLASATSCSATPSTAR